MRFLFFILLSFSLRANITITDSDLGSGTYHWTNDNIYVLDGFVFLETNGELHIQEGTVIKGLETPTNGDNTSALIITRGAKIYAIGNSNNPIIFTTEWDDTNNPIDLNSQDKGLWGGLIVLGYGRLAFQNETASVEGIPTSEIRATYGGNDDDDNSGILRYISIRHGGAELSPGNEINGLTLGGVGRGTMVDHIEIYANQDDGIEWFGGTVACKNLIVAFCGDDGFDYDFGWRGKGQHWFALQSSIEADNGGEHDGAKPDGETPFSKPEIWNVTFIGSGVGSEAKNSTALHFRDASGGIYVNSIFIDYAKHALEVEDLPATSGVDSRQRMEDGDLKLLNNIWWDFGSGTELSCDSDGILRPTSDGEDITCQFLIDHLNNNDNSLEDPMLGMISRDTDGLLDPRPSASGPAYSNLVIPTDSWFDIVTYKGAFGNWNWAMNWTALFEYGHFDLTTSVEDLSMENDFYVYPNPCELTVNIKLKLSSEIKIINMGGQILKQVNMGVGTHKIYLNDLPNGIYFISGQNEFGLETFKIVKHHK